jgi:hypothetical protein
VHADHSIAGGLRARPLEARPDRNAGLIFFVTDIHSAKEDILVDEQDHQIDLATALGEEVPDVSRPA